MNKFLDQLFQPQTARKRGSLQENNHQTNNISIKAQDQQNNEKHVNSSQQQCQNEEYEIQEVTEQINFAPAENEKNIYQIHPSQIRYSQSLPNQNLVYEKDKPNINIKQVNDFLEINPDEILNTQTTRNYVEVNQKQVQSEITSPQFSNRLQSQLEIQQCLHFNRRIQKDKTGQTNEDRQKKKEKSISQLMNILYQAKQSQIVFQQWFSKQKNLFSKFIAQSFKQITRNVSLFASQAKQEKQRNEPQNMRSSLSMERKWQIQKKLIKEELQQRYQYRIEKLQQELQQQRKEAQQRINYFTQKQVDNEQNMSPRGQTINRQLDEELQFIKKQLQLKQTQINQLEVQNQKLNEHIFDIEQQIEGIQLQVQDRVRQKIKLIQNNSVQADSKLQGKQRDFNKYQNQGKGPNLLHPILQASSNLQQSSRLFGFNSVNVRNQKLQQLARQNFNLKGQNTEFKRQKESLQKQVEYLKNLVRRLEDEGSKRQSQLKEAQKITKFREEQIKRNEQDINMEWSQIESEKQSFLLREQELTTAQDNISRKISQIRAKQLDIEKLEIELKKKSAALLFKQQQVINKLEQVKTFEASLKFEHENHYKQQRENRLRLQKQLQYQSLSQKNFNKYSVMQDNHTNSRKKIGDFNTEGGGSFRQNQIQVGYKPSDIQIPNLPIGKKNQELYRVEKKLEGDAQPKSQYQFKNQYPSRNKDALKQNMEKSFEELDKSYGRIKQREKYVATTTNFRSGRGPHNVHQYILPQTSKGNQRSVSKSRSKQKNLVRNSNLGLTGMSSNSIGNYSTNAMGSHLKSGLKGNKYVEELYHTKQQANLDGLGSKLERLRDEIKRQIDSIK